MSGRVGVDHGHEAMTGSAIAIATGGIGEDFLGVTRPTSITIGGGIEIVSGIESTVETFGQTEGETDQTDRAKSATLETHAIESGNTEGWPGTIEGARGARQEIHGTSHVSSVDNRTLLLLFINVKSRRTITAPSLLTRVDVASGSGLPLEQNG